MGRFIKIYFWQFLSLISGFATMFIVTPFISSNQNLFGIYSFVISLNLFLSYSDFGFISAGIKFASEAVIQKNIKEEQKILGFLLFIMSIVFLGFLIVVLFFYYNPAIILKGIKSDTEIEVAKNLFLIFILSSPITLFHRILQLVFNIRLEDYKYQRVYSAFNIIKIGVAVLLFSKYEYPIVGYYIFFNILNLIALVIGVYLSIKNYNYNYWNFIKYFRFSRDVFKKTKSLAFGSLIVTISWIIYYELDNIVIGRLVGIQEVALFSVCLSLMTFSRSLFGIIYNPFSVKFNYYLGEGKINELNGVFRKIVLLGLPVSVFSTLIVVLTMGSLISLWVGVNYLPAEPIAILMYSSYFFSFLSYPAGIAMIARQKLKDMYLVSFLLPVIYWLGIFFSFDLLGLTAFGLFKFCAFFTSAIVYFIFSKRVMQLNWKELFRNNILAFLVVFMLIYFACNASTSYFVGSKNISLLVQYLFFVLILFSFSCFLFFLISSDCRRVIQDAWEDFRSKRSLKGKENTIS